MYSSRVPGEPKKRDEKGTCLAMNIGESISCGDRNFELFDPSFLQLTAVTRL